MICVWALDIHSHSWGSYMRSDVFSLIKADSVLNGFLFKVEWFLGTTEELSIN